MLRSTLRLTLIASLALTGSACSVIYKLPTRQGNVIEQKQLDQLKLGMSHDQVKFLMGTPIAASPYAADRWDYFGYYKSPRGDISKRNVTLYFDGDKLAKMDGVQLAGADSKGLETPDIETLVAPGKKDADDSGVKPPSGVNVPTGH